MKNILIDAGPLIALFDKDDSYHIKALQFIKNQDAILRTTWPVITEVMYMLGFNVSVQTDFLSWIDRGGLDIINISTGDIKRIIELMRNYSNVPMDLVDATLILASELTGIKEIITIDSDFLVYRNIRNDYLKNIFI